MFSLRTWWRWGVCGVRVTRWSSRTSTTWLTATQSCGLIYRTGGLTNVKQKRWSRSLNAENSAAVQVPFIRNIVTAHQWLHRTFKTYRLTGGFFVTGINLTEDLKYICSHPTESLKDMVMSTHPMLLGWVREQKPGSCLDSLNIIAADFVTESDFIPTVVALNEQLLSRGTWGGGGDEDGDDGDAALGFAQYLAHSTQDFMFTYHLK